MADKRDILVRLLGEETVSRMSDRAGDGLDRFGDKLDATEKDAKDLDRQIGEVERDLKALAVAFARTNDAADRVDITRAIRKQQTELRKLTKAKDLLPKIEPAEFGKQGIQAGTAFSGGFRQVVTRALASPQGLVVGGALAAQLVPMLSAAVEGAVVGGVGVGGVIGGVALAARDARVQAAGEELGETIMGDLDESAARFVSPTIQGIGIIRSAWNDVADDVDAVFASTARYVEPLARGVGDFVRQITPGIRKAAEAAGPIIREIGEGLPRIGRALGDMFSDFADDAGEGASALRYVFMVAEAGIRVVGGAIHAFAGMYRAVLNIADAAITAEEALLGWNPIFKGTIADGRRKVDELKGALDKGGDAGKGAGDKIEGGLLRAGTAADVSAEKIETWADVVRTSTDRAIASENANIRLEQAIDDAADAAKEGAKKGIDPNTEAGRKNRLALLGIAEAAKAASDDILTNTGSHELAAEATERGRKKFLEAADAMGVEEGKAKDLADKLFGIPQEVHSTVTVTAYTQPALDNAKGVVARINSMKARINVYAEPHGSFGGSAHTGFGNSTGYSSGGYVDGTGPKGVDSVRAMLAPGEGVFTAAEVDAVGGRAGFERLRAAIRSGQPGGFTAPSAAAARAVPLAAGQGFDPSAVAAALRAAFADLAIQVFIGDRELTDIVDVQIGARDRGLKRRVGAGAGR